MAIYDYQGNQLNACYDADGNALSAAYDVDGNQIFSAGSGSPVTLKVMTYNVGQWYLGSDVIVPASLDEAFYDLHCGTFQRNDVDICGIEEYTPQFSEKPRQASDITNQFFTKEASQYDGTYYGRAFCSKYPISDYTKHYYSNETARYYDSAKVNVNGREIFVVVTHLSTDTVKRVGQISELLAFLEAQYAPNGTSGAKVPVICFGDFNLDLPTYPDEKELYYASSFGMVNQAGFDGSAEVVPKDVSTYEGHFSRFYSTMPASGLGLDNILFSPNIELLSAYVDTAKQDAADQSIFIDPTSGKPKPDHMPLIATLRIS